MVAHGNVCCFADAGQEMSHGNDMMAGTDGQTECGPSFITADAQELDFGGSCHSVLFCRFKFFQIKKEIKTNP